MILWEMVKLLLLMCNFTIIPLELVINLPVNVFSYFIVTFYIIDIVVSLNRCYFKDGEFIDNIQ